MFKGFCWFLLALATGLQSSSARTIYQVPCSSFKQNITKVADRLFPTIADHIFDESLVESFGTFYGAAPTSPPREMLAISLDLVEYFEHWEPQLYNDPAGYCTIGYGHLINLKRCETIKSPPFTGGITKNKGDALLQDDTIYSRRSVQTLVDVSLTDEQFSALASFVFNIGSDKFSNSTLLEHLRNGDFAGAAEQFPLWIKANGKVLPGLITRRACERLLFLGELHLDTHGRFDASSCITYGAAPTGTLIDIRVGE